MAWASAEGLGAILPHKRYGAPCISCRLSSVTRIRASEAWLGLLKANLSGGQQMSRRQIQRQRYGDGAMVANGKNVAAGEKRAPEEPLSGVENLVIIGSSPTGYIATIYAARANLKPVMFEGY